MEIGPLGYEYYGPDVPDIWIYGGDITGKDKGWWGINFAYKFQRFTILGYAFLAIFAFFLLRKKRFALIPIGLNLALAILFPLWMKTYISGVVSNSDGADLTVYYKYGWVLYFAIVILNVYILSATLLSKAQDRKNS